MREPSEAELREERSIARVVEGRARAADWRALDLAAERDGEVWDRLLASLRLEAELGGAGDWLDGVARGVAPTEDDAGSRPTMDDAGWRPTMDDAGWRPGGAGTFARALVAASVLVLGWLALREPATRLRPPGGAAGPETDPRQAERLARERAPAPLDELLPVVVDARPAADGDGYEVTYLRRIVERETVPALYELGFDEHARPAPRPLEPSGPAPVGSF